MVARIKSVAHCVFGFFCLFLVTANVHSEIVEVTRNGGSTQCAPTIGGDLVEGSVAYCDQTYTWINLPVEMDGLVTEFISVSDADSGAGDYGLTVTLNSAGSFLLLIDPTVDVATDMAWVIDDGYVKIDGINITQDQGDSSVVFDIWELDVDGPANPIVTGPQNDATATNYAVLFVSWLADLELNIVDFPNPYILGSGAHWSRTYTVENLGYENADDIVIRLFAQGVNDSSPVSFSTSPNSTFNSQGQFRWRVPSLDVGATATLSIVRVFGENQKTGTGVVSFGVEIESMFPTDPNLENNFVMESTSVLDIAYSISNVTRLGSSANCAPAPAGTLMENVVAYCDEPHTWVMIPPEAEGVPLEYIAVADADSSVSDYGLSFSVGQPGQVLLLIDSSIDVPGEMPWVVSDGYQEEEGINVGQDRGGPPENFAIWVRDIEDMENPVVTGPQNNGSVGNYGVVYAIDAQDLELSVVAGPSPYRLGSDEFFVRTWTLTNLGASDGGEIVVGFSAGGFTQVNSVSLETSPNSDWNSLGERKWRIPYLGSGDSATFVVSLKFGPEQQNGPDVVSFGGMIESWHGLDPVLSNNMVAETLTIFGQKVFEDGFEDPPAEAQ